MHKERYWPQNWPLVKNLQFWFNLDQILSNWLSHLCDLLTKFHENWTKIVDFSLIANFEASTVLFASVFMYHWTIDMKLLKKYYLQWHFSWSFQKGKNCLGDKEAFFFLSSIPHNFLWVFFSECNDYKLFHRKWNPVYSTFFQDWFF